MSGDGKQRWSDFELECVRQLEQQSPRTSDDEAEQRGGGSEWETFEGCAQSITRLYRQPHWSSFQQAAATTTQLYKDSQESRRRGFDRGSSTGRRRLVKELLRYLRNATGTSHIRREELIAIMAGRTAPPPPPPQHQPPSQQQQQQAYASASPVVGTFDRLRLSPPKSDVGNRSPHDNLPIGLHRSSSVVGAVGGAAAAPESGDVTALTMFHEALHHKATSEGQQNAATNTVASPRSRRQDLSAFLVDQLQRHRVAARKRHRHDTSSSPGHKRHKRY